MSVRAGGPEAPEESSVESLVARTVAACAEVHRSLGPGLLESAYELCLCRELALAGLAFQRQSRLPLPYKGVLLASGYRIDLLVEGAVLVEIKALPRLAPVHEAQVRTYLRISGLPAGLLVNFDVIVFERGLRRFRP